MGRNGHSAALEARITAQRFEFKYAISEMQALAIRDYVDAYTTKDQYLGQEREYPLESLYFDGPQLGTYQSSENGERNRYKIRARAYVANRIDSLYCEIKQRNDQVLKKYRVRLAMDEAQEYFVRHRTAASLLERLSTEDKHHFYKFRDLMDLQQATPRVLVRYRREARVSADGEPVRITFDRQLACRPCFVYDTDVWNATGSWYPVSDFDVILEIKFTDSYPEWLDRMVKRFHLTARSICKYVLCVRELNRNGVRVGGTGIQAMSA